MDPRVTILLPTHNRADVLGYAIKSVLWQTEGDFELLIVGDGCTDNTPDVVATFPDPRIRWFDLPKAPRSGYANRNIALRQARGRYVAYAQHDDIMFPDHIESLIATIEASGADWAYSRPLWVTADGVVLPFSVNLTYGDELDNFLKVENYIPSSCVMHTRRALERVGFWPENEADADWLCWQRIIMTSTSSTVGYCQLPTALHFRAAWKQDISPRERRLRVIADSDWWPQVCKVSIPMGAAEQRIFFETLSSAPSTWINKLRSAVTEIVDRLAWGWTVPAARTWPYYDTTMLKFTAALEQYWISRFPLSRRLATAIFRKLR
jgi:Glycosyl transferase family 2